MPWFSLPQLNLDQEPVLREKLLFGIALATAFVFFYSYVLAPKAKAMVLLRGDLRGVESEMDSVHRLIEATEAQLSKEHQSKAQNVKLDAWVARVLNRRVADSVEEISTTVDQLRSRKVARRVKISDVTLGNKVKVEGFEVVPITVRLGGRYSGIRGYIASVERIERPLVIESFDIKSDVNTPGRLSAKIVLHLYLMKKGS